MNLGRRKKENVTLSAEFRRDYVAFTAMAAFFLILIGEVALAISIPAYLQRENAMSKEVARLKMFSLFDGLRYGINAELNKPKSELASAELRLLKWDADLMAAYIRKEKTRLSEREVADLTARIQKMYGYLAPLRRGAVVSSEARLNTAPYVDFLLKKKDGKNGK